MAIAAKHIAKIVFLAVCLLVSVVPPSVVAREKANTDQNLVMQVIRQHVEKNSPWAPDAVRIEFLHSLPVLSGLTGKVSFRVESRSREEYIGDTTFKLRILQNNVFVKEESVRVRIEVLHEFVVSANSLGRNAILSADDLSVQSKWVRAIPLNVIHSTDDVIGKALASTVRPGMSITRNMLRDIPAVQRGKRVQVVLDNGMMTMVMNGLAEEDGAEDAMVRVRNLSSNKVIYARVVGQGRVQIDF